MYMHARQSSTPFCPKIVTCISPLKSRFSQSSFIYYSTAYSYCNLFGTCTCTVYLVIIVQTIIGWIPYHFLQQYCAICHIINYTPCFVYLCREEDNSNTAARSASHIVLHAGWFVCNVYNNVPFCLTKVTKVAHYIYVHNYYSSFCSTLY